ncbi:type 1 diacylglycerol acyltransferase [Hibiscus syriacus]|uniref:Type 1 diacylglycerol acyltransferase n=1 Tax=Hibiscus syriacus TaxID=106335 RepID=A0A6A2XBR4_HIBSY|nr:type 1 diacylglycerol acyltransferase [Hibiscus syriacus]
MEGFKSKSYRDGEMQKEGGPSNMQDLRCYSATYANAVQPNQIKMKKSKSSFGSSSKTWTFNDPELLRKKRVAGYKVMLLKAR